MIAAFRSASCRGIIDSPFYAESPDARQGARSGAALTIAGKVTYDE